MGWILTEKNKIEKIGVSALCRISAKGGSGTYLYVPRLFAETYGLISGNVVEVYFRRVFKTVYAEEEPSEKRVIDLSKERGKRKKEN
jgi:hypothetical protein